MTLKEAMQNLDKAIDDAKKALYQKNGTGLHDDEIVVYNMVKVKVDDLFGFIDFLQRNRYECRKEISRSPFRNTEK